MRKLIAVDKDEVAQLRADLAAARELLREAIPHLVGNGHWDWVARVQAHLDLADTKKNDPG